MEPGCGMDGICSFADQGRKVRAGLADPSLCRKLTRSRMQLDLHGSANRGQGTWAFLIGSGRHWRVLRGELIGDGLNKVRQQRAQQSLQVHLGEIGEEEGMSKRTETFGDWRREWEDGEGEEVEQRPVG